MMNEADEEYIHEYLVNAGLGDAASVFYSAIEISQVPFALDGWNGHSFLRHLIDYAEQRGRAAERERCAVICERSAAGWDKALGNNGNASVCVNASVEAVSLAAAIRAPSDEP